MRFKDLTGMTFGRITVVERSEKVNKNGNKVYWRCQCSCGSPIKDIRGSVISSGITVSCGCVRKQTSAERSKKYNTFKISGDHVIGYTSKNKEFIVDLEDYERIKEVCWYMDNAGYIVNKTRNENTKLHRFIMNVTDSKVQVDHIDNKKKFDNRKSNLRICSHGENQQNKPLTKRNKSGVAGVLWHKPLNKWRVRIVKDKKEFHLGVFNSFDEAVKVRLEAEKKYFNEFAPQKHLFEVYGVN